MLISEEHEPDESKYIYVTSECTKSDGQMRDKEINFPSCELRLVDSRQDIFAYKGLTGK